MDKDFFPEEYASEVFENTKIDAKTTILAMINTLKDFFLIG